MAQAEYRNVTEDRVVTRTETVTIRKIELLLSIGEAQFLADILMKVSGDPVETRRGKGTDISQALHDVGIFGFCNIDRLASDITGSLTCHERKVNYPNQNSKGGFTHGF